MAEEAVALTNVLGPSPLSLALTGLMRAAPSDAEAARRCPARHFVAQDGRLTVRSAPLT